MKWKKAVFMQFLSQSLFSSCPLNPLQIEGIKIENVADALVLYIFQFYIYRFFLTIIHYMAGLCTIRIEELVPSI